MDDFLYDKQIFQKFCCQRSSDIMKINKTQLLAKMSIYYHSIEKGLSLPNPKFNFGIDSGILNKIYIMTEVFIKRFGIDHPILNSIYHTLLEYRTFHISNKQLIKCNKINTFLEKYKFLNCKDKKGGTKTITRFNGNISDDFFLTRRSVRNFNNKKIDIKDVQEVIQNSIYGTPTVCNRQINRVKVITDPELKNKLLSLQAGNLGFRSNIPGLLIVTANLENYENIKERRSPYIGAGMFSQSLVYALHSKGFGSCCLNWDTSHKNDIAVKKLLNIDNETIIMYIAFGYYDKIKVAFSEKLPLKDIMHVY